MFEKQTIGIILVALAIMITGVMAVGKFKSKIQEEQDGSPGMLVKHEVWLFLAPIVLVIAIIYGFGLFKPTVQQETPGTPDLVPYTRTLHYSPTPVVPIPNANYLPRIKLLPLPYGIQPKFRFL